MSTLVMRSSADLQLMRVLVAISEMYFSDGGLWKQLSPSLVTFRKLQNAG